MRDEPHFDYDVFLSHSSKDKPIVREIAERLKKDGIRVWFDEWEIKPGDSIPAKIEEGLEHSRVLVLCMSANAFGSDWAQLESGTFRFRDPLNKERRFLPLRLDDAPIKASLAQLLPIDWRPSNRQHSSYSKLYDMCRSTMSPSVPSSVLNLYSVSIREDGIASSRGERINTYSFIEKEGKVLTGSDDGMVRLWELATGTCLKTFAGHTDAVWSVVSTADGHHAISSSVDTTLRLWDIESGRCLTELTGHKDWVRGAVLSKDERYALSIADDSTMRLWDLNSGQCIRVFEGHYGLVLHAAWSEDELTALSCGSDRTIKHWSIQTGECIHTSHWAGAELWSMAWCSTRDELFVGCGDGGLLVFDTRSGLVRAVLEGHSLGIRRVVVSPNRQFLLSASHDTTVRIWDIEKRICIGVLRGHRSPVVRVAWSLSGLAAFSGDRSGSIKVWNLARCIDPPEPTSLAGNAADLVPNQVQYTNAKVLVVGESGVGKTGLSNYLAHGIRVEDDNPLPSTDGAWATHWPLKHDKFKAGVDREIWLWDFAGQVDYRLVHQLFMDDTAAAVLVFNPQKEDLFEGLGRWDRDLQKATRKPFAKLLAAARVDRGSLVVSAASMKKFMEERAFLVPLHETSAKTGVGCGALKEAIVQAIDWQSIPQTTSPALYHRMKQEILALRDGGIVLIRLAELKQRMEMVLGELRFDLAELDAVVSLLSGPGMIQRLDFGGFILLRPEVLSRYAAAAVRTVRQHPMELGCILEADFLEGQLDYQDFKRLPREDEAVVLRALVETFLNRAWCLRQPCDDTAMLTFPSYFGRERLEQPSHPNVLVTYRFDGPVDEIYATLVVRLHHTVAFDNADLWKSAADFQTQTGAKLGVTLTPESEGTSRLEVYFEPDVDANSRVLFLRYVHDHLEQQAQNVVRLRHYCCGNKKCRAFEQPFKDREAIDEALAPGGEGKVFCGKCGKPISLRDVIEKKFDSPAIKEQVREMQAESQFVIDNESKELILVGHAFSIVAEAGQIFRPTANSDHGIDGEIEFKDDQGNASGKRLYIQLKSGDAYLTKRQRDDIDIFKIKNTRWADYWQQQAYPVMLVIRTSNGEIRWMNVTEVLKRQSSPMKQIEFTGERFDVMSVRRWRDRVLRGG